MEHKIYLTRRNVQTLINKLDRVKDGDFSHCTLLKRDTQHAKYPQTMTVCSVSAAEAIMEGTKFYPYQIYLTRQNLYDLLSYGDSPAGPKARRTDAGFKLSLDGEDTLCVTFLEDEDYYGPGRPPGFSQDAPK